MTSLLPTAEPSGPERPLVADEPERSIRRILPPQAPAVIIGGGPAGITLAIAMAMQGQEVWVLERGSWPKDKVCGEGLMPTGVEALRRLGVYDKIAPDMQHPFRGIAWIDDGGARAEADFGEGQGLGVRRLGLSRALIERAEELDGIHLVSGARLTDVAHEPDCVRIEVEINDRVRTVRTKLLVAADGLRSLVRRALELDGPAPVKQRRWGARQHFRVAPWSEHVEVYWAEGVEAYVTPSSTERVEIAFLWDEDRFQLPLKGTRMIEGLLSCFPELEERLADCEIESRAASTGPLARAALSPIQDRVVLIGDALLYLDGITGEGISVAVLASEAIAPQLVELLEADSLTEAQLRPVADTLDQIYDESFRMTHLALLLTRSTGLRRTVIHGMSRSPPLMTHFLEANMARVRPWDMPIGGILRFLWGVVLPRGALLSGVLPWLAVGVLAVGMRLWMHWALDLRDLPGPAASITLIRAWLEPVQIQWDVQIIGALQGVLGSVERAGWTASMLGSLAQVAGASLLAWSLLGRGAGLAAGVVASLWSMSVHDALILGANPIATGLAWLGTGLCVSGVASGRKGLPLVVGGALMAVLGAAVKVVVLPVLPLLGAVALVRAPSLRSRIGTAFFAGLTTWLAWEWLEPESSQQLVGSPRVGWSSIPDGWAGLLDMAGRGHPEGYLELIVGAAVVGALLPGPRWAARVLMVGLSLGLVLATSAMLGPVVKPRYLLPPSLGLVAMSGVALSLLAQHIYRIRPQALSLVAVFPLWLFMDGVAFMEGLGQRRVDYAGAEAPALPRLPEAFSSRYADLPDPILLGLTARGMVDLRTLLVEHEGGGAVPMLRDNRHTQAELLAELEDRSFRVLDPKSCCQGMSRESCAERVVQALDRSGMTLFLPLQSPHQRRVKADDDGWLQELQLAAESIHEGNAQETPWWWVAPARGTEEDPPCRPGPSAIGGDPNRRAGDRGG